MIEDVGQKNLDEGAVEFINEKLQFLREDLAPQFTEMILSNEDADDIVYQKNRITAQMFFLSINKEKVH